MRKINFLFVAVFLTASIYASANSPQALQIPPRQPDAVGGAEFMARITLMNLADREAAIFEEISNGNIPDSFRQVNRISKRMLDRNNVEHDVVLEVLPDFLAIGSDDDFCRIPMTPMTAQRLATLFGATLPTSKISDLAWEFAEIKIDPWQTTETPDHTMTTVPVFVSNNARIEVLRKAFGKPLSTPIAGHKKDIIISNRIHTDAQGRNRVFIYGWHQISPPRPPADHGRPIQNINGSHSIDYVDYSHGVRLVNQEMLLNGEVVRVRDILRDPIKYRLISNETGIMVITEYGGEPEIPNPPPSELTSFAVVPENATSVRIFISTESGVNYRIRYGTDITNLTQVVEFNASNPIISGLTENQLYFFAVEAYNSYGSAPLSKRLAATPTNEEIFALVVVGFNRNIAGNHGMFVRQHAEALFALDKPVASATNFAVIAGLINVNDYPFISWMLGEDSTVDTTLNATERDIVENYLESGGFLYISGSEIGWDLGRQGAGQNAVAFFRDYLKSVFVATSPGPGTQPSGLSRTALVLPDAGFGNDNFSFRFADGTEASTTVNFPDVLLPAEGAVGFLRYILTAGGDTNVYYGGTAYAGTFGKSTTPARVVVMGIPFEAIMPADARKELMRRILNFDKVPSSVVNPIVVNNQIFSTLNGIRVELERLSEVQIFDITGKLIHRTKTDTSFEYPLARGVYLVKIDNEVRKIVR